MTGSHDAVDHLLAASDDDPVAGPDPVLHSFAVHARFRREADGGPQAETLVRAELQVVRGLYDDVKVEPREPDGRWAVDARFVVASLDAETAVEGVHATLRDHGLTPDEAWVAEQLP